MSAAPQLLRQGERTQVSAAKAAALVLVRMKSKSSEGNGIMQGNQHKTCAVKTKLEPAQPGSPSHPACAGPHWDGTWHHSPSPAKDLEAPRA